MEQSALEPDEIGVVIAGDYIDIAHMVDAFDRTALQLKLAQSPDVDWSASRAAIKIRLNEPSRQNKDAFKEEFKERFFGRLMPVYMMAGNAVMIARDPGTHYLTIACKNQAGERTGGTHKVGLVAAGFDVGVMRAISQFRMAALLYGRPVTITEPVKFSQGQNKSTLPWRDATAEAFIGKEAWRRLQNTNQHQAAAHTTRNKQWEHVQSRFFGKTMPSLLDEDVTLITACDPQTNDIKMICLDPKIKQGP